MWLPKQPGQPWVDSECGRWRILGARNHNPPTHAGWPAIEPLVYVLFRRRHGVAGSYATLDEAKAAAR